MTDTDTDPTPSSASPEAQAQAQAEERDLLRAHLDEAMLENLRLRELLEQQSVQLAEATKSAPVPVVVAYTALVVGADVPLPLERAVCQLGPFLVARRYEPEDSDNVALVEFRAADSSADAVIPLAQHLLTAALPGVSLRVEQRRIEGSPVTPSPNP